MDLVIYVSPLSPVNTPVFGAYSADSATGSGSTIGDEGGWFMYNDYPVGPFEIQAGNPANGDNIIGSFDVIDNLDGTFTVTYEMNAGVIVVEEHLSISDDPNFTGKPGQDDNQDFGVPFSDADGSFSIFAHFSVIY